METKIEFSSPITTEILKLHFENSITIANSNCKNYPEYNCINSKENHTYNKLKKKITKEDLQKVYKLNRLRMEKKSYEDKEIYKTGFTDCLKIIQAITEFNTDKSLL